MTEPTASIYRDAAGEWRWRLRAANGEIVAQGEGYSERKHAIEGFIAAQRAFNEPRIDEEGSER